MKGTVPFAPATTCGAMTFRDIVSGLRPRTPHTTHLQQISRHSVLQPELLTLVVVCLQDGLSVFPAPSYTTGSSTATRSVKLNSLSLCLKE
jgi:hypothetical protein